MADEQVLEQEQTKTDTVDVSTILQKAAFGDNEHSQENNTDATKEVKDVVEEKKEEVQEIPVPVEWLKKEFDTEDVSILKAEREELKSAKEKLKKFEIDVNGFKVLDYLKPENEDKLFEFLNKKKSIEKFTSIEVNENNAAEIVKFQMQQKYNGTLSTEDINHKFNKQFGLPKEPQEDKFYTTTEYEEAKQEWEQKVKDINAELLIEAKLSIPEIQKLKTELILPNIEREMPSAKEPTPEELAAFNKQKESFLQSFNNVSKDFNGFTAQVKNKDVDYNVAYTPSQEERNLVSQKMQKFAESNFDANALFADIWLNKEGEIDIQRMTEDLSRILMGKNSDAKIANEAANKRMELYLQSKKQIDINELNEEGKLRLDKANETVEDRLRERMMQLS